MPADMKEQIARAATTLLIDKNVKKLTVKGIVEECHITRQTFYYHFEDIPHLLHWIMVNGFAQMQDQAKEYDTMEARMRYMFTIAAQIKPYVDKTMSSNYGAELEHLMREEIFRLAEEIADAEHLSQNLSRDEMRIVMQYHTHAIIGLINDYCNAPAEKVDRVVHTACRILRGRIALTD